MDIENPKHKLHLVKTRVRSCVCMHTGTKIHDEVSYFVFAICEGLHLACFVLKFFSLGLSLADHERRTELDGRFSIQVFFSEFFHFEHLLCPRRLLQVLVILLPKYQINLSINSLWIAPREL